MINYIFGASGCGKTEYIYGCIEKNIVNRKQSYILVPEQYSMFSEREMLKRLGFDAQRWVSVLTFSRLSNMILSSKGPLRMKYIDGAGKNMLALRALMLCEKSLGYFSKNIHQKGFSTVLVSLFSEFKRYGITDEALESAIEKSENRELKAKLSDFKILYAKYNELLNEKNSDAEDNLKIVIPKIAACDFLKGKIYINHFKSFTPVEYDAIAELMKISDITLAFVADKTENPENLDGAFRSVGLTVKKLTKLSENLGIEQTKNIYLTQTVKFEKNSELSFLRDNCLSFNPEKYRKKCENIRILRPRTYYDEVVCAAKHIVKKLRKEDYVPEDFLLLVSNAENYEDILPVVFEKYGISCFLDKKTAVSSKPFIRFILSVLEILAYGFSYERIMTCLRSGFFGIEKSEVDLFENYFLAAAPSKRQLFSEADFVRNPDPEKFDMKLINSVKKRAINTIISLSKSIKGRKTADKICSVFYLWLIDIDIKLGYEKKIDEALKSGDEETAREFETIWNTFAAILSQLEEMFFGTYVTYTDFYELFSAAVSDIKLGKTPPLSNQVTVTETENFRSTDAKIVMVLGATEGEFPKNFSEDGTLSDAERDELSEFGMALAPTAFEKLLDEQYLVYSVLTAPRESLFVMSPVSDMEGKELQKSEIITTLKNIFPDLKEEYPEEIMKFDTEYFLEGQNAAFESLEEKLCIAKGEINLLPVFWQKIYEYFCSDDKYRKKLEDIKNMITVSEKKESLSKETAELLYGKPLMLSVSKLEKYNACAFSYFLTYGLFADERKKAAVLSNDVGSALHEALCTYFERKNREDADYSRLTKSVVKKEIEKIIDESANLQDNILYENSAYYRYTLLRIKDIAAATAWKIVRFYAQSSFRPYGFEIRIGDGGTFPSFTVRLDNGEAKINGFIDRMDISEIDGRKYFNIVDYKSSEKSVDKTLAECGVQFQPLLYAGIVKENIENSAPAAMLYMKMNDPVASYADRQKKGEPEKQHMDEIKVDGIVLNDDEVIKNLDADHGDKKAVHYIPSSKNSILSSAEMDMMLSDALKTAKDTSKKISDGEIEINPVFIKNKYDACAYCKFSDVCGINE